MNTFPYTRDDLPAIEFRRTSLAVASAMFDNIYDLITDDFFPLSDALAEMRSCLNHLAVAADESSSVYSVFPS